MARSKKAEVERAAEAAGAGAGPQQLPLLDDGAVVEVLLPGREPRGPGRPPGALNRRTADMLAYLEGLGLQPPMLQLARTAAADTRTLARALRCSIADAFDRQQSARVALLPYWHAKLGAENAEEGRVVSLTVINRGDPAADEAIVTNQGVSRGVLVTVGQGTSDDEE